MDTLQQQIATCFPDAYSPNTWKDLLLQFIAYQLDLYEKQVDRYSKEFTLWEMSDQAIPAPTYPVMPAAFAEACEQQAQKEGFDFRALACCLYISKQRHESLQEQYRQAYQLCGEYDEVSTELRQAYLTLQSGTKPGKRLN